MSASNPTEASSAAPAPRLLKRPPAVVKRLAKQEINAKEDWEAESDGEQESRPQEEEKAQEPESSNLPDVASLQLGRQAKSAVAQDDWPDLGGKGLSVGNASAAESSRSVWDKA